MPFKSRSAAPWIFLCVILIVVATMAFSPVRADEAYRDGLRPPLARVLADSAPDSLVPVSVVLKEQADPVSLRAAAAAKNRGEARRVVLNRLKSLARSTQASLLSRLRELRRERKVARVRPLWIGNVVGVDATPDVVREIASRPEVAWVNYNPKVDIRLLQTGGASEDLPAFGNTGSGPAPGIGLDGSTTEIECGVAQMRAPDVWNDLGVTGDGAVVALIDSGTCWTHPDIIDQIWVNPGEDLDGDGEVMDPDDRNGVDDDGNGFVDDLIGWDFDGNDPEPDDTNSHGSHTAGTIAGDGTSGTQAGMAPDAKIMVIKVGLTFSDEVDVWNAMQYAADNGADTISMSLGWPHDQNPDRATWRQNCENTIEAGTAMVIAAGNEGSGNEPDNVRTPGDVPRVITVGAVNCSDAAASFSSRGPVTWQDVPSYNDYPYPPGLVKPDVAAPGVNTKSHNLCSGYSVKSGTSMATPHVAGTVALMVSANPGLSPDEIRQVLEDTSVDLGSAGKDNTYGSGRVDAYEAVNAVFGLTLESVTVQDNDPDLANGDGGVDTGEVDTLIVTLRNQWDDRSATSVRGWITTDTPGVALVHDYATWPDVPPLGTAASNAPHFSVKVDQGCNYPIEFLLTLRYNDRSSRIRFSVRVGSPYARTLLSDDFENDQGWMVSGTSATGIFVREDPNGVEDSSGSAVQPEDDTTADPGALCWVTGNDDRSAGDDDVDKGTAIITSPVMDATDFDQATIRYSRWFYAFPSTFPPSDFFRILWSRDGDTWNLLEELVQGGSEWVSAENPLPGTAFGPGLRIRFEVEDSPEVLMDSVVEGLVDDFHLSGERIECEPFDPPVVSPPNPVGSTLRLEKTLESVRMEWTAPPADATHDPATLYRAYRSADPSGGFTVDGLSTETWRVVADGLEQPDSAYYLVASENGGGVSGEVP